MPAGPCAVRDLARAARVLQFCTFNYARVWTVRPLELPGCKALVDGLRQLFCFITRLCRCSAGLMSIIIIISTSTKKKYHTVISPDCSGELQLARAVW